MMAGKSEADQLGSIRDAIGSAYDGLHPSHQEELTITGGLFAIATAINRLAAAVEGLRD
jgi:formyltetrahydrofolate synthetase